MAQTQSQQAAVLQGQKTRQRSGRRVKGLWLYVLAVPLLVVMAFPYLFLILQSFASWDQVNRTFLPTSFTLRSYQWIFNGGGYLAQPWLQALLNSILVTAVDSICMVALGAIVGYALSVMEFRGKKLINNFILFQMFYPGIILLVPTFLIIRYSGFYNTYWAMIIPKMMSLWAVFMYTGFFRSVSPEVIEAARLDGASELQIVFRIMMPMARSITTIIFLFVSMERWTDLMWDLIVVKDASRQTLNVLLSTMFGPYGTYQGPLYAAGVILTLPVLLLFIAFSRNFVKGVQLVLR
uniref:Sugar ABC transporter permease n=1 Tax=Thermosporothrix sp. COM3 TaxID=2490863 RepID=A0A455SF81_9CHLR|nr:sugar ABC transporter permease [Thermosporothrix sp. COM3]